MIFEIHDARIPNNILDALNKTCLFFTFTGSRCFGFEKYDSDWDFIVNIDHFRLDEELLKLVDLSQEKLIKARTENKRSHYDSLMCHYFSIGGHKVNLIIVDNVGNRIFKRAHYITDNLIHQKILNKNNYKDAFISIRTTLGTVEK